MEIFSGLNKKILEENILFDEIYGINNGGKFVEPIKNPFSCEAEFLEEVSRIDGEISSNEEVGNDVSELKRVKEWLNKLFYEYL